MEVGRIWGNWTIKRPRRSLRLQPCRRAVRFQNCRYKRGGSNSSWRGGWIDRLRLLRGTLPLASLPVVIRQTLDEAPEWVITVPGMAFMCRDKTSNRNATTDLERQPSHAFTTPGFQPLVQGADRESPLRSNHIGKRCRGHQPVRTNFAADHQPRRVTSPESASVDPIAIRMFRQRDDGPFFWTPPEGAHRFRNR